MKPSLLSGDCLERLRAMASDQVDSLVTDPPAGISFMGKEWDHHKGGRKEWVAWMTSVMSEALRVMKPGAHGLVWALPRTSHWTATALEDAGFEVRDVVTHLFGTGFPKSLDVSKAIDKGKGAERAVIAERKKLQSYGANEVYVQGPDKGGIQKITAPATDAAKQWQGWGTALKPASEHWILVRKPLSEKTVAANVLKWGTGAINVDASRIGTEDKRARPRGSFPLSDDSWGNGRPNEISVPNPQGRFPANLTLDEYAAGLLDEQSLAGGMHSAGKAKSPDEWEKGFKGYNASSYHMGMERKPHRLGDSGGASRFFYVAKASKADKNAGLEGMEPKMYAPSGGAAAAAARGEEYHGEGGMNRTSMRLNHHPTVKSTALMTYLIRMVTPPGGTVLDPFMGSGSTGVAARGLKLHFIGIEQDPDYLKIASARINKA